jgi:hypothetical protein
MSRAEPAPSAAAGAVRLVRVDELRTSYAALRPGGAAPGPLDLVDLPLRVAPAAADGSFEVLDGFKRLARQRERGTDLIPVVVQPQTRCIEHKALLLQSNAPRRTVTAADEARVVCSLLDEDELTKPAVGRLLGRRPAWVESRVAIGRHLSAAGGARLARGQIGPSLATALAQLPGADQAALLAVIEGHGLKDREAATLVGAYRVADEADRKLLLHDPLGAVRPPPAVQVFSPRLVELEQALADIQRALQRLAEFRLPADLPDPEQRRLQAQLQGVLGQLQRAARAHGLVVAPGDGGSAPAPGAPAPPHEPGGAPDPSPRPAADRSPAPPRRSARPPQQPQPVEDEHGRPGPEQRCPAEARAYPLAGAPVDGGSERGSVQAAGAAPRRADGGRAGGDRGAAPLLRHPAARAPRGPQPQGDPQGADGGGGAPTKPAPGHREQAGPVPPADRGEVVPGPHHLPDPP